MTAGELCTKDVVVATRDETLVEAARRMRDRHVGMLIVVDEIGGRSIPIAVLTDRDVVIRAVAEGPESVARARVRDCMTDEVIWAHHADAVDDVLARMTASGVRRLPLVDDDGGLFGVLAFDDVLALLSEELTDLTRLISRERGRERSVRT
jgi:predicted transcriptional regulator